MERRKHKRYKVNLQSYGHNGDTFFKAQIDSISEAGASISCNDNTYLNYDQKLKLKLKVSDENITIEATVIKKVYDMHFKTSYIILFDEALSMSHFEEQENQFKKTAA